MRLGERLAKELASQKKSTQPASQPPGITSRAETEATAPQGTKAPTGTVSTLKRRRKSLKQTLKKIRLLKELFEWNT